MAPEYTGKLVVAGGQTRVERVSRKGNPTLADVAPGALSAGLASLPAAERDGIEVTFELDPNTQRARKVRRAGETWMPPAQAPVTAVADDGPVEGDFHNPYTFVPALPRDTDHPDLGDTGGGEPIGHDRLAPDRWEGVLEVVMTVRTPLLVPDTGKVEEIDDGHKVFPLRLDADGAPQLPVTGVKGMLRSAHEAVTNSRLGVFEKHEERLTYRADREKRKYPVAPRRVIDATLLPADAAAKRSPSDRLFGWVHGDGEGAWRGQVRITPPHCEQGAAAVGPLDSGDRNGVALAILSAPKPTQVRFYGAADALGTPHEDGWQLGQRGYRRGEGLRGRKMYVYDPGLPEVYWEQPWTDRTQEPQGERHQEYRRPDDRRSKPQRDDQNRSVRAWVKPRSTFRFRVHVRNASSVDLGALLWLLTLDEDQALRFGGGKPLGFGCVHVRLDPARSRLARGTDVARSYRQLEGLPGAGAEAVDAAVQRCVEDYRDAVVSAEVAAGRDGKSFEQVPYIAAFLAVTRGVATGKPVHYPRARRHGQDDPVGPHRDGKNFEWFVANERPAQRGGGRHALPGATDARGLPMLDKDG